MGRSKLPVTSGRPACFTERSTFSISAVLSPRLTPILYAKSRSTTGVAPFVVTMLIRPTAMRPLDATKLPSCAKSTRPDALTAVCAKSIPVAAPATASTRRSRPVIS